MKQKIYWIEVLKFFAALMITNSHYKFLYPESIQALGTFGATGNALFFFISGYLLTFSKREESFTQWYCRRLKRLWASFFIYSALIAPLFLQQPITFDRIWLGGNFWFLKCIAVYYIIYYIVSKYNLLITSLICSFILSILYFFYLPITHNSIYINNFHYVCFLSIMLLGALCAKYNLFNKNDNNIKRLLLYSFASLFFFYFFQFIGKGYSGYRYWLQILSLVPLHSFVYYFYKLISTPKVESFFSKKTIKCIVRICATLTLEIYIVGFNFVYFTYLNKLFPLNLLIITILLIFSAYCLNVLTTLFVQFMGNEKINIRLALRLF